MKDPKGKCPSCGLRKLRSVDQYNGRPWPAVLCVRCGAFFPDQKSESFRTSCRDCGKTMGHVTMHRQYGQRDRAEVSEALRRVDAELADPETWKNARRMEELKGVRSEIQGIVPWEELVDEEKGRHLCLACYRKRHEAGRDASGAAVHHPILCRICGKPMGDGDETNWHAYEAVHHPDEMERKFREEVRHVHGSSGQELSPCSLKLHETNKNDRTLDDLAKKTVGQSSETG